MSDGPILLQIALHIGGLSLVAVGGGNALIPALHEQAVDTMHWLTEGGFAEAVGLSQAAPGPNMLLMPLIGWQTAGATGAVVALAAFVLPSSTIAVVGARLIARHAHSAFVTSLKWSLRPVTGGLMVSASIVLTQSAARTWPHPSVAASVALALLGAGVAFASLRWKLNPLVYLAAAALLGAIV